MQKSRWLPVLAALVLLFPVLSGCAHSSSNRLNILATTGSGVPIDVQNENRMSSGDFDRMTRDIIGEIHAKAPLADGKRQLLIFVHGGLTPYKGAVKKADSIKTPIEEAGYYPLFIVWPSNMRRTYFEHLFLVRQGRIRKWVGPLTSPLVLTADLAEGIVHTPLAWCELIETAFSTGSNTLLRHQADARTREKALLEEENSIHLVIGEDKRGWWNKTWRSALWIVTLPTKLLSVPLIDGWGRPAYENMQRRTHTMFRGSGEFENSETAQERKLDAKGSGAIALFFSDLAEYSEENPDIEITLIGHSMGTIVANRILRDNPELPIRNVVYLAAACTIQDFWDSVVPFLRMERHQETEFFNLSLHPIAESREMVKLDLAMRGSLLEWIDDFLSVPLTEAHRTLGKWDNIILASHLIPDDVRERVTLRSFNAGDDDPQKHGALDNHAFWERAFWSGE